MRRKTRSMLALERRHGQPVEQLITGALTEHGTIRRAADSLGVNSQTFYGWMRLLRIEVKKVAYVEGQAAVA